MTGDSEGERGVIFDVDGVLIDSYWPHFRSWLALADERNCHRMSEEEFQATFGRTSREVIAELWPAEELSPELIAELDNRKEVLFREMLANDFPAMPGAVELITALEQAGVRIAAGSSGPPENVHLVLEKLGRPDAFSAVVTGGDVHRGKPHPEVFLKCAEGLGLPPAQCAVIEDAVVGVQAASAAGCLSIALMSAGGDERRFANANHRVRSLETLAPRLICEWLDACRHAR